jgi:hypothetical protein
MPGLIWFVMALIAIFIVAVYARLTWAGGGFDA